MGWRPAEMGVRFKIDAGEIRPTQRLRVETNMKLRRIAEELNSDRWKLPTSRLNQRNRFTI
jgi:hypothetical protein